MRINNKLGTLLSLLLLLITVSLHSQNEIKIIASHFPPYTIEEGYVIQAGQYAGLEAEEHTGYGLDIDILIEALVRAGVDYSLRFVPYARLKNEMEQDQGYVASGLFYSEDENGFPKWNYILYDLGGATVLYKKQDSTIQVETLEDLESLKIGIVREDYYGDEFAKAREDGFIRDEYLEMASDDDLNIKKLMGERIDIIAINNIVGPYLMKMNNLTDKVVQLSLRFPYGIDPKTDGIYFAFGWNIDYRIVNRIRDVIEEMKHDGTISSIRSQYGISSDNESLDH